MPLNSAHKSFSLIAKKEFGIARAVISRLEEDFLARQICGRPLPFSSLFIKMGLLGNPEIAQVLQRREVMARRCKVCFRKTYLLPQERSSEKLCEHCSGELIMGRIDNDSKRLQRLKQVSEKAELQSDPNLYVKAARLALELNRIDDARSYLANVLKDRPGYKPAQNLIEEFIQHFSPASGRFKILAKS